MLPLLIYICFRTLCVFNTQPWNGKETFFDAKGDKCVDIRLSADLYMMIIIAYNFSFFSFFFFLRLCTEVHVADGDDDDDVVDTKFQCL